MDVNLLDKIWLKLLNKIWIKLIIIMFEIKLNIQKDNETL